MSERLPPGSAEALGVVAAAAAAALVVEPVWAAERPQTVAEALTPAVVVVVEVVEVMVSGQRLSRPAAVAVTAAPAASRRPKWPPRPVAVAGSVWLRK